MPTRRGRAALRTSLSGGRNRVDRARAGSRGFRHRARDFLAHRGVLFQQSSIQAQQTLLHQVAIDQKPAQEIIRTAGDRGNSLRHHAAGAALRHGQRRVTLTQKRPHHRFERIAVARKNPISEPLFDRPSHFRQQTLGFFFALAAGAKMDLQIAGRGQNRRGRIGVLRVHRRDELIQVGFRHAGDTVEARADHLARQAAGQPRHAFLDEQRLELAGRTGQQNHHAPLVLDPLAHGRPVGIRQGLGALHQKRLALVVFGHLALAAAEALFDGVVEILSEDQWPAQRFGHGFACEIVLGRAQASRENDDLRVRKRLAGGCGEQGAVVSDDQLAAHLHSQRVELIGEEQRVGVQALGGQHFRPHGDDFRVSPCMGNRKENRDSALCPTLGASR